VLGGVCGIAAILIILLLWMRAIRRKRAHAARQSEQSDDKRRSGEYNYEERGLRPLAKAGEPMGRSPVPSAVISDADSTAMFGARPDPKYLIRRVSSDRAQTGLRGSGIGFGQALFKREKASQLSISRPMNPVLGDYKERPSIDLGTATPAVVPVVTKAAPTRKASQRKTDEGWGKYFQRGPQDLQDTNRTTWLSRGSGTTSRGKSGSFWPGSGVPEETTRSSAGRSPRIVIRDSAGNPLEAHVVAAGSPSLEHGPPNPQSRGLQAVQGSTARISNVSSATNTDDENDYEDEHLDPAFSSGVPASIHEQTWTPVGNTWSGPFQRPLRHPSSYFANPPPQTAASSETRRTSDTQSSSIPSFPMPNSVRSPGTSTAMEAAMDRSEIRSDYFGEEGVRSRTPEHLQGNNNDMSWLNLGTPRR
jgi:hypothetical protein